MEVSSDLALSLDSSDRFPVNDFVESPDTKQLQEELRRLKAELDECRSLVTVAECEKENVVETEQRKCKEEVASIQHIMEEAINDAVTSTSDRFQKEISQLQKTCEKLETELLESKSKEKTDISKEGVLAAVTKSLKRVSNLGNPLLTSSSGESIENLEESMRKAQEDAEMLRSLVVPLEEEIKALKDKLRSTDEQLRVYETAFANLVKGLGSDSLSEMIKGKGPAEVVEHLDEKLMTLNKGLQAEKASRSDLEMYVAVLNTQKGVVQEDMERIKQELQEVCQLLEKEKKEHALLKRTWQMANDQFLETQRLQIMDMSRVQNVLTSEQQRQILEAKKKDEQRLELEKQILKRDEKDNVLDIGKGEKQLPPPSPSTSLKKVKISRQSHTASDTCSTKSLELSLPSDTQTRARSIPENLNTSENVFVEKRSLSSSALNGMASGSIQSDASLDLTESSPLKDSQMTPTTSKKLTQDQLKALSDITPEQEVRKSLLDCARAEFETLSLVGRRLVSETEWQLLEEELKRAREKLGQPCEMCCNYELQLQQVQRREVDERNKASVLNQTLDDYRKDLQREQEHRKEMEEKFDKIHAECSEKVTKLNNIGEGYEKSLSKIKFKFDTCQKESKEFQASIFSERDELKKELDRIQNENFVLLGKHLGKAQQIRNADINLPGSLEDLQFYCLQKQEELINVMAAKEAMEESLKGDIQMLKNQLMSEQTEKGNVEESYMQEIYHLKHQLEILERIKEQLKVQQDGNSILEGNCQKLQQKVESRDEKLSQLQSQVTDLSNSKSRFETEVYELKSKVQSLQSDLDNSEAVQRDFVKLSQSLQVELEKIRQSDCEVRWQHDEDVTECNTCKKTFQSRKEKLHCNHCGKIFCSDCVSRTVNGGPKNRQFKVCNVCHTLLDQKTAPYFSSDPPHSPS